MYFQVRIAIMRKTLFLLFLFFASCKDYAPYELEGNEVKTIFSGLMQEAIDNSHNNTPGVGISIKCSPRNINYTGAVGFDSKDKSYPLETDQPFRIASITKTFVATAILRLHELDSISVQDPISKYISSEHQSILKEDEYKLDEITILHCLNHTSGLFDYAMGGSPYGDFVKQNPQKRWTRTEQIQFAVEHGTKLGYPGERYGYSDTGYVLLGEIIEYFFDGDLAKGLRTLIGYEKLSMEQTWMESLEEEPEGAKRPVRRYFQGMDATQFDASTDLYGGGGIVSTLGDLNKFMSALFNEKVFSKKSSLELMLEKPKYDEGYDITKDSRYKDYRQGLWKVMINNEDVFMHSGLWGTHLLHQPSSNTTVVANFTYGGSDRLIKKLFMSIHSIDKTK